MEKKGIILLMKVSHKIKVFLLIVWNCFLICLVIFFAKKNFNLFLSINSLENKYHIPTTESINSTIPKNYTFPTSDSRIIYTYIHDLFNQNYLIDFNTSDYFFWREKGQYTINLSSTPYHVVIGIPIKPEDLGIGLSTPEQLGYVKELTKNINDVFQRSGFILQKDFSKVTVRFTDAVTDYNFTAFKNANGMRCIVSQPSDTYVPNVPEGFVINNVNYLAYIFIACANQDDYDRAVSEQMPFLKDLKVSKDTPIKISQNDGQFAIIGSSTLLYKENSKWTNISYLGGSILSCNFVDKYRIPERIIPTCLDKNNNVKNVVY